MEKNKYPIIPIIINPRFNIKVYRKNKETSFPTKIYPYDAAYDVSSPSIHIIRPSGFCSISLGLHFEFPSDYVMLIQSRSGMSHKDGIFTIGNIIDSTYRGNVHVCLVNISNKLYHINQGDRIAQILFLKLCPYPLVEVDSLKDLTISQRQEMGMGSSGK